LIELGNINLNIKKQECTEVELSVKQPDVCVAKEILTKTLNPEEVEVEVDVIDYDEALRRAGGFGIYQAILFWASSTFAVYGDQLIHNFVYLTSTYKLLCQFSGETNFKECSRE